MNTMRHVLIVLRFAMKSLSSLWLLTFFSVTIDIVTFSQTFHSKALIFAQVLLILAHVKKTYGRE